MKKLEIKPNTLVAVRDSENAGWAIARGYYESGNWRLLDEGGGMIYVDKKHLEPYLQLRKEYLNAIEAFEKNYSAVYARLALKVFGDDSGNYQELLKDEYKPGSLVIVIADENSGSDTPDDLGIVWKKWENGCDVQMGWRRTRKNVPFGQLRFIAQTNGHTYNPQRVLRRFGCQLSFLLATQDEGLKASRRQKNASLVLSKIRQMLARS